MEFMDVFRLQKWVMLTVKAKGIQKRSDFWMSLGFLERTNEWVRAHNHGVGLLWRLEEWWDRAVRPREGEGEVLEGKVLISIRCYLNSEKYNWTGKVAHWVRTLVAKADDLSSVPQSHKVKEENRFTHKIDVFRKWWHRHLVLALRRQRQEDIWVWSQPRLQGYTDKSCLIKTKTK